MKGMYGTVRCGTLLGLPILSSDILVYVFTVSSVDSISPFPQMFDDPGTALVCCTSLPLCDLLVWNVACLTHFVFLLLRCANFAKHLLRVLNHFVANAVQLFL